MTEKDVITKIILKRGMVVKFKSFFCMVLVLLSCASMQGIKFYLKWKENKFEISKEAVEKAVYLQGWYDKYKDLEKADKDYDKLFDKDGNFVFDIKILLSGLVLPNGKAFLDLIDKIDIESVVAFLDNPKSTLLLGGKASSARKLAVFTIFAEEFGNKDALKACFDVLRKQLSQEQLVKFLEKDSSYLYSISEFVPGWMLNDFQFPLQKPYFKNIEKETFTISANSEDFKIAAWDDKRNGVLCVYKSYWQGLSDETVKRIEERNLSEVDELRFLRTALPERTRQRYMERFLPFGDTTVEAKKIKKNMYEKIVENLGKKCGRVSGGVVSCALKYRYFVTYEGTSLKLYSFDYKSKPLIEGRTKGKIIDVFVSLSGAKIVVAQEIVPAEFGGFDEVSITVIDLNVASFLSGIFRQDLVLAALSAYKEKYKKPFVYNSRNERIGWLSEETKKKLFKANLLEKDGPEEKRIRERKKKKRAEELSEGI